MKSFAAFVMRGPAYAGSLAGAGMLAGLALPPLAWLSSAVVALVMLRLGATALARMAVPALAGVLIVGALVFRQPAAVTLASLGAWIPVVLVAAVLRHRARLDDALLAACALGWLTVVALQLAVGDPAAAWRPVLMQMFPPERVATGTGFTAADVTQAIERMAPWMSALMAASAVFSTITSVLLARWWQALLDREGAFGREFRALRLGRVAAGVAVAVCLAAALTQAPLMVGLALVAVTVYLFQGLAVVHGVVAARGMARGWLIGLYVLALLLPPQVVTGLALVGAFDAWADFRGVAVGPS